MQQDLRKSPPDLGGIPDAPLIVGFDPGRDKCGVALVEGETRQILWHGVVAASEAIALLQSIQARPGIATLVLGNQTTARTWQERLTQGLNLNPGVIILVDERNSTLEARDRYWQMYPPQGLTRLLPHGLRQPPRPIDDIVAILLIERYWQQNAS